MTKLELLTKKVSDISNTSVRSVLLSNIENGDIATMAAIVFGALSYCSEEDADRKPLNEVFNLLA